ncbi:MAG TPA: heparinase II/III family protein, partial [Candidatus Hydrogenedentes bacterium]|nr:heparinase II/III family protein [Candidatus Hydrogenedentota bacterium]
ATFYRELEQHDTRGNASVRGGRLFAQTLDESVDLCRISLGYDRVYRDLCFSAADHARIAEGLLRPMVETIRPHGAGISNWQTWHNAGVACAGFVLGDRDLVDWALNGKHGFFFQMHNGSVVESGMWYEESPSYHWYALRALVYLMEPATRAGIDLYADPMTRKLFTAPIRQLFPDLTFPALHDSNRDDIRAQRGLYAVAWARYQDPQFAALATPLDSPWALFWGGAPPYSGGMGIPPMGSDHGREARAMWFETSNEESEGLAILRDVSGETAVFVDYGPGCSGHVQPAKLNLILFAHGDERFVDPGRLPYGNPLHGAWYRQTVAHNTVVVDGVSQRQGPGRLIAFRDTPSYALVHAAADKAYDGVRLERVVVLSRNVILDVFRCQSDVPRTYDLPLHTRGALEIATEPSPSGSENVLGTANGYELIEDTEQLPRDCREAVVATTAGRRIHVRWFDSADVFRGIGLGATPREKLPMLLRRQEGNEAVFAAVYTLLEAGETPPRCSFEHGAQRVVLRADDVALRLGQEAHVRVYGKSGRS